MRAGKAQRGRKDARLKPSSYSTSVARANFASALETTDRQKLIVGFARYKRTVAALVPIEAVRMLAGQNDVDPQVKAKIVRLAQMFVAAAAADEESPPAPRKAAKKKAAKKAKAKKGKKAPARRKGLGKTA